HRVWPMAALQIEYSLLYREEAEEALAVCRELGIGLVAYAPLGRSLLTGGVSRVEDIPEDDRRRQHPRFEPGNLEANLALVGRLRRWRGRRGRRRASSPWPGSSPGDPTWCRSPGPSGARGSRRTWARWASS